MPTPGRPFQGAAKYGLAGRCSEVGRAGSRASRIRRQSWSGTDGGERVVGSSSPLPGRAVHKIIVRLVCHRLGCADAGVLQGLPAPVLVRAWRAGCVCRGELTMGGLFARMSAAASARARTVCRQTGGAAGWVPVGVRSGLGRPRQNSRGRDRTGTVPDLVSQGHLRACSNTAVNVSVIVRLCSPSRQGQITERSRPVVCQVEYVWL